MSQFEELKQVERVAEYSVASLCKDYGMSFVGALLTIGWIIKEPEKALEALRNGII